MFARRAIRSLVLPLALAGCSSGGSECTTDVDCPTGRYCRESGKCAYDCTFDTDCPAGFHCTVWGRCERFCTQSNGGVEDCDGVDNDCDSETDEGLPGRECWLENPHGRCSGWEMCLELAWSCDAVAPAAEVCDQVDNDCDGATDEELERDACVKENEFGRCTGVERCLPEGWTCAAPIPSPEICDGADNDCDGMIDEGAAQSPDCEIGFLAADGLDNNCNGVIDEPGGCVTRVTLGETVYYVDTYEGVVNTRQDCAGSAYGQEANDYPPTWPSTGVATTPLYGCSLPGVRPSAYLSQLQAQRACVAQGKRLCTKLELANACGGEVWQAYPYGDTFQPVFCNTFVTGYARSIENGFLPSCVSPFGIYDASGNLWEHVEDQCPSDPQMVSMQGGSFDCVYCTAPNECVPCDLDNPLHAGLISDVYQCHFPGQYVACVRPNVVSQIVGFRCCWNGP